MPYDLSAADRIRAILQPRRGFTEKTMFGGIGFLLNANMCIGLWKEFLILRVGPDPYVELLEKPHVKEFDITGRPMTGWIMVQPGGFATDSALRQWLDLATDYVGALPPKSKARRKPKKKAARKK